MNSWQTHNITSSDGVEDCWMRGKFSQKHDVLPWCSYVEWDFTDRGLALTVADGHQVRSSRVVMNWVLL